MPVTCASRSAVSGVTARFAFTTSFRRGKDTIPAYVLQEFHNLPNGNYSNSLMRGYIAG